jgi:hypothetical protein
MKRSATLTDHLEICSVLGIVKAAEWSVFDTESVLPKM